MIDDDPDIGDVARLALEQLGPYAVVTASSGEEGLRLGREQRPDAILLDVMMPGMDGPSTLARLGDDDVLAGVPVLFLTAKAQASERDRLERLPVSGMIAKPFDPRTLSADVGRLLGLTYGAGRAVSRGAVARAAAADLAEEPPHHH